MQLREGTNNTKTIIQEVDPRMQVPVVSAVPITTEKECQQQPTCCEHDIPVTACHVSEANDNIEYLRVTPTAVLVNNDQRYDSHTLSASYIPSVDGCRRRAEFISVTLLEKPAQLGIGMRNSSRRRGKRVEITDIRPGSPLLESPIQVGDTLFSINGHACYGQTPQQVRQMLHGLTGQTVTLVARNRQGGDATLLETMVEKKAPNASIGLHARTCGTKFVKVTKIAETSLLAGSLLVCTRTMTCCCS